MVIVILFLGSLVISVVLTMYFVLKESNDIELSKSILYSFKQKESDGDLDKLIEFSKTHIHKYKI